MSPNSNPLMKVCPSNMNSAPQTGGNNIVRDSNSSMKPSTSNITDTSLTSGNGGGKVENPIPSMKESTSNVLRASLTSGNVNVECSIPSLKASSKMWPEHLQRRESEKSKSSIDSNHSFSTCI